MKKVLVVIDMQNDFVDGALGTKEAVQIVANAADKIKAFDGKVIVTYDTHFKNYMNTNEGKNLPVPHCIKGTKGWKLNDSIEKALIGKDVIKTEKETFGSIELPKLINEYAGTEKVQIQLIGLCTDICVISNALILKANYPQADISVDASCCAGVTPNTHQAALETMKMCQIKITE